MSKVLLYFEGLESITLSFSALIEVASKIVLNLAHIAFNITLSSAFDFDQF